MDRVHQPLITRSVLLFVAPKIDKVMNVRFGPVPVKVESARVDRVRCVCGTLRPPSPNDVAGARLSGWPCVAHIGLNDRRKLLELIRSEREGPLALFRK